MRRKNKTDQADVGSLKVMKLSGCDSSVTVQHAKEVKEVERRCLSPKTDWAIGVDGVDVVVVEGSKSWKESRRFIYLSRREPERRLRHASALLPQMC